jgi:hypothetical protein
MLQQREIDARYGPLVEAANAEGRRDDAHCHRQDWAMEKYEIEEERRLASQGRLLRRARRWLVPIPKFTDDNSEETIAGMQRLLNEEAQFELLREIVKARRESVEYVTKVAASLIGILGAIIGLVAVLRK